MKKIGILFGMENTFPPAFVDKVNSMKIDGVTAEFVKLGGVKMADPSGYRVIVDRISQDIPFYRAYLKNAVLNGNDRGQQSVLVDGGRQVFQLRAGDQAGRGDSADSALASQQTSRGHYGPVHAQLDLSFELGGDF